MVRKIPSAGTTTLMSSIVNGGLLEEVLPSSVKSSMPVSESLEKVSMTSGERSEAVSEARR